VNFQRLPDEIKFQFHLCAIPANTSPHAQQALIDFLPDIPLDLRVSLRKYAQLRGKLHWNACFSAGWKGLIAPRFALERRVHEAMTL
jgi:hypothetical protein